jgi:glycerophosphoryl diester phosphodiesterase
VAGRRWLRTVGTALGALALFTSLAPAAAFEIWGHRGARGLRPENTIAAFEQALREGVDALELDVHLTADDVPVVTHDAALSPDRTRDASGRWIDAPGPRLRDMTLVQLRAWDVGRARPGGRTASDFPDQAPADGERVPTLAAVLSLGDGRPRLVIELKYDPRRPDEGAPLEPLVDATLRVIAEADASSRVLLQSFDWQVLRRVQQVAPAIPTAYLTSQRPHHDTVSDGRWTAGFSLAAQGSVPRMVRAAGGRWWLPQHRDLTAESVREAHALGLKVAAWTVNDPSDLARTAALGVDAVITDRPDGARRLRR